MSLFKHTHHHVLQLDSPIPSLNLIQSQTLLPFPSPMDLLDLDLFDPISLPSPFHHLTHFHQTTSTYQYLPSPVPANLSRSDLYYLTTLSDRLSALESTVNTLTNPKPKIKSKPAKTKVNYKWTAEINNGDGIERKYEWSAKIKGDDLEKIEQKVVGVKGKKVKNVKNCIWTSEIKGRGEHAAVQKYTLEVSTGKNKIHKEKKEKEDVHQIVEIEEITDNPGAIVLKQVFAKRAGALNAKGKKKELSLQDAAVLIQNSFRTYLIRRSKMLRGLRELAVAKNKLKELRKLFNNFSYRRRIAYDAEECQKFTERIIVVLLTVDAIEGVDVMVRAAKRSMVDELEAMLDFVDPQPAGSRSLSIKRRTFDLPTGDIQKEIAAGVARVVKMLNEDDNGTDDSTFES